MQTPCPQQIRPIWMLGCRHCLPPAAAGVERNAKIGLDEEARKKDIPIVQVGCGTAASSVCWVGEGASP